jgi:hypothetical protein
MDKSRTIRKLQTRSPSFPEVIPEQPLVPGEEITWQVLCGDAGHWRVGLYSPSEAAPEEIIELERHDCPELFLLISGQLTLVLSSKGEIVELPLEPGRPVLVTAPHSGYCPAGPHTGVALVVERDAFETEYRHVDLW